MIQWTPPTRSSPKRYALDDYETSDDETEEEITANNGHGHSESKGEERASKRSKR
jgi:hypothetical protein